MTSEQPYYVLENDPNVTIERGPYEDKFTRFPEGIKTLLAIRQDIVRVLVKGDIQTFTKNTSKSVLYPEPLDYLFQAQNCQKINTNIFWINERKWGIIMHGVKVLENEGSE